jgi:hypothetical protein
MSCGNGEQQIPAAEMERMMKAQEVILKMWTPGSGLVNSTASGHVCAVTRVSIAWLEEIVQVGLSATWDQI